MATQQETTIICLPFREEKNSVRRSGIAQCAPPRRLRPNLVRSRYSLGALYIRSCFAHGTVPLRCGTLNFFLVELYVHSRNKAEQNTGVLIRL